MLVEKSEKVYKEPSLSEEINRMLRSTRSTIIGTRPSRKKNQGIYQHGDGNESNLRRRPTQNESRFWRSTRDVSTPRVSTSDVSGDWLTPMSHIRDRSTMTINSRRQTISRFRNVNPLQWWTYLLYSTTRVIFTCQLQMFGRIHPEWRPDIPTRFV